MRFGCLTSNEFIQKQNKWTFVHKAHFQPLDSESFTILRQEKTKPLLPHTTSIMPQDSYRPAPTKWALWKMNENVASRKLSWFHVYLKPVQACPAVALSVPTNFTQHPLLCLGTGDCTEAWWIGSELKNHFSPVKGGLLLACIRSLM